MTTHDPTRPSPNPSDSILMSLARAALEPGMSLDEASWPKLNLGDPAQREFGDYELLEEIGRGGMGVVYRARQRSLDRDVAIKFISAGLADSVNVARFLSEARAAARLMHPNIVPVHEVGSIDGVHYFSMPMVRGRTLADRLDADALPAGEVVSLMLKLCDAVGYAHRLGLLHLDLKPANVLIDERGEPLVSDFGLARHMDERGEVLAQEVSGTPAFMAPEQILIKQYRLTPGTDVYALGAILYRALAGVSPHGEGKPDELTQRAVAGRVRPLAEVAPKAPRDLAAVAMHCLELLQKDRYPSVAALADDLRRVRDGLPVSVRAPGALERMQRWVRREPKFAGAVSAAVLALLLGTAATAWQWREASAQRDAALAQRERATLASEIGAHLFTFAGEEDDRAADLLGWLRQRLAGDENRQADALAAFAASVDGENRNYTETLLLGVIEQLGGDYRQRMIEALQQGDHPRRDLYSAVLAWTDEADTQQPGRFAGFLDAALKADPTDKFAQKMAAIYCAHGELCSQPDAGQALVRMDSDNMFAWLMLAHRAATMAEARKALAQAAQRARFDDYFGDDWSIYFDAIEAAAVPVPPLIARPAAILDPAARPQDIVAHLSAYNMKLPAWQPVIRACGLGAEAMPADPATQADCLKIGTAMMRDGKSILSQMIGVLLVRNLTQDADLRDEALQKRRTYQYLGAMLESLPPQQRTSFTSAQMMRNAQDLGELAAWQKNIEQFGIPSTPPVDWMPADPTSSLSSPERIAKIEALVRDGAARVSEGHHAEAIALMNPYVETIDSAWVGHYLRARFLTVLGRARAGAGDHEAAEETLRQAWDTARQYPPGTPDTRTTARALLDLYTAWSHVEPGMGHERKIEEWTHTLAALEAADDR